MIVDRVVSYLEMTSPEQLVPGREAPTPLALEPVEPGAPLVRATHLRVGRPHHWSTLLWTDEQWAAQLAYPHQHNWIVRVEREVAGLTSIDHPHALPNYLARGFRLYRTVHSSKDIPDG